MPAACKGTRRHADEHEVPLADSTLRFRGPPQEPVNNEPHPHGAAKRPSGGFAQHRAPRSGREHPGGSISAAYTIKGPKPRGGPHDLGRGVRELSGG